MKYKKSIIFCVIAIGLFGLKFGLLKLAKKSPEFVERVYSRGIYPVISNILTFFANIFPFSLGELLIAISVVLLLVFLVKIAIRLFKKKWISTFQLFSSCLLIVATVVFYLDISWLYNNYRLEVKETMGLDGRVITPEDLANTYKALVEKTVEIRSKLQQEDFLSRKDIYKTAYEGYIKLHEQYDFISDNRVVVKGLLSSPIQTASGYSGMYMFFAGEPTVNREMPIISLPHTAAHEIAHQKGFAFEDEANYISFLACKNHDSLHFQYSGYLSAMVYAGNALYDQDYEKYKEIRSLYSEEMIADLKAISEFWTKNEKEKASKVVNSVNDTYLKSYNQPEGVKSYGKFVDLLIMDYLYDGDI